MNRFLYPFIAMTLVLLAVACAESDTTAPSVVETFPPNGSMDVDPSITEIWVAFSEEMRDGNWSWAYTEKDKFPEMTDQPYYTENFTKNVLPVKLEPNKAYEIWINSQKYKNFKDKAGNSSIPYRWTFKTK